MLFFETSAKSGEGVDNMMYNCISKLPFFDQFKIDNKDNLIRDLSKVNSNNNNEDKIFEINNNPPYNVNNGENSTNIILTKNKDEEKPKKKCGC